MSPSENQLFAISTTERVCSAISLAATAIVVVSFICSSAFRKPINRLVFYASWGNIMANLATVISQSGIRAGLDSPLCQFQAFLMQWFMPADALWTLAMACNVYLTFFRKYDSEQLRRLEWKYLLFCYGLPFVPAFTYFFIRTKARGRVYGSALIWCWVAPSWDFLRIAVFYGPVWFVIFLTFAIYARTGGVIYQKRRQLRRAGSLGSENLKPSFSKTTEVSITSEVSSPNECYRPTGQIFSPITSNHPHLFINPYSVTIEGGPSGAIALKTVKNDPPNPHLQRRIMAAEANSAAWAYTKYAMLFFVALIITWVPSTINRVYALAYPQKFSFVLNYLSSFVLPLQGFWNSIIYMSVSWPAFKSTFKKFHQGKLLGTSLGSHTTAEMGNGDRPPCPSCTNDSTERLTS